MQKTRESQARFLHVKHPITKLWVPSPLLNTLIPFAKETMTVDNTVHHFGRKDAILAFISAETAQMRYWLDGEEPTASVGHLLEVGDEKSFLYYDIKGFGVIRTGAVSGVIQVTYYKYEDN